MNLIYFLMASWSAATAVDKTISDLTAAVDKLTKNLEKLQSGLLCNTTEKNRKREVLFRGQPEIGTVSVSSVFRYAGIETKKS